MQKRPLSLVVAYDSYSRAIGTKNKIPWKAPSDMRHFARKTKQGVLIMGRKTFESIGRTLPGRYSIVITSTPQKFEEGVRLSFVSSLGVAIEMAEEIIRQGEYSGIFVIGGETVYREALERDLVAVIHETVVATGKNLEADAFFPELRKTDWEIKVEGNNYGVQGSELVVRENEIQVKNGAVFEPLLIYRKLLRVNR